MRTRMPDASISLEDLKKLIAVHKEEGRKLIGEMKKLQSHFEKMQEYYSEWEDDMTALEGLIDQHKEEHGLPIEKIVEYNVLDDIMGDLGETKPEPELTDVLGGIFE